ncbi:hypothetical protein TIFTF001_040686 [Ficus carica]|uniref:Uncharacterized protein n=1 Tax=Ficus carica TaxID=3494 RepID=A0AA87ZFC7_FICCA|nr:hypothetical protein TIFTF001_040686 [Ficus carica]
MEKKDFTYIDIQENRLEGDVAPLFKSTKKLQFADLSGNLFKFDLSDVDFPKTLVYLDLSENMIYGALPEGLTELPSLRHFNVSSNRLCGKIPVGGNLQKFNESSYLNNICLCGSPLPSCSSLRDIFILSKCFLRCMFSSYDFGISTGTTTLLT